MRFAIYLGGFRRRFVPGMGPISSAHARISRLKTAYGPQRPYECLDMGKPSGWDVGTAI